MPYIHIAGYRYLWACYTFTTRIPRLTRLYVVVAPVTRFICRCLLTTHTVYVVVTRLVYWDCWDGYCLDGLPLPLVATHTPVLPGFASPVGLRTLRHVYIFALAPFPVGTLRPPAITGRFGYYDADALRFTFARYCYLCSVVVIVVVLLRSRPVGCTIGLDYLILRGCFRSVTHYRILFAVVTCVTHTRYVAFVVTFTTLPHYLVPAFPHLPVTPLVTFVAFARLHAAFAYVVTYCGYLHLPLFVVICCPGFSWLIYTLPLPIDRLWTRRGTSVVDCRRHLIPHPFPRYYVVGTTFPMVPITGLRLELPLPFGSYVPSRYPFTPTLPHTTVADFLARLPHYITAFPDYLWFTFPG